MSERDPNGRVNFSIPCAWELTEAIKHYAKLTNIRLVNLYASGSLRRPL